MKEIKPQKKTEIISDKKFLKFFDIQYEENKHYYAVTRRNVKESFAVLGETEGKFSLPDAVTISFIIENSNSEKLLYMNYEYRYAVGRFLLSPPAGLIDDDEKAAAENELNDLIVSEFAELLHKPFAKPLFPDSFSFFLFHVS